MAEPKIVISLLTYVNDYVKLLFGAKEVPAPRAWCPLSRLGIYQKIFFGRGGGVGKRHQFPLISRKGAPEKLELLRDILIFSRILDL